MGHGISTKESMAESSQTAENGPVSGGLVCCFGEMLIDFVPTESGVSLAEAPAFVKAAGGAPANVAIAVVRLGGKSAFIGKLGDDEFGYFLKGVLEQNGVNADGVVFDAEARTALAFVTLRKDGEREFMFYRHPSADMRLKDEELNLSVLRKAKVLHYGSISLISEPCRAAHLHAMKEAKAAGAILSFDPNLRLPLWPSQEAAREMIMSIWKDADIIKISENEQEFLTKDGSLNDEVSFSLMHEKLKLLIVTVGDQGCKYFTHKFHGMVGTVKVHAVDTTGAGDAFVGALLKQISEDASVLEDEERLRKVLKFANVCGAITTTKRGAIPSLPREEEVLQLLHEN